MPIDLPGERIGWLLGIFFLPLSSVLNISEHPVRVSTALPITITENSCKECRLCAVRSHVPRCRNVWRRCWNVCVGDIRVSRGSLLFYSSSTPSLSPSDGLQLSSWVVSLFHCLVNLSVRKYFISYTWTGDCIELCELLFSSSKSDHRTFNGYPFCFHNNRNKSQIIYMFCRLVT